MCTNWCQLFFYRNPRFVCAFDWAGFNDSQVTNSPITGVSQIEAFWRPPIKPLILRLTMFSHNQQLSSSPRVRCPNRVPPRSGPGSVPARRPGLLPRDFRKVLLQVPRSLGPILQLSPSWRPRWIHGDNLRWNGDKSMVIIICSYG